MIARQDSEAQEEAQMDDIDGEPFDMDEDMVLESELPAVLLEEAKQRTDLPEDPPRMPEPEVPAPKSKGRGRGGGRGGKKRADGSQVGSKSTRQCQACFKHFDASLFPPASIYCSEDKKARDALYRAAMQENEMDWFNETMLDPASRRKLFVEYHLRCPPPLAGKAKSRFNVLRYKDQLETVRHKAPPSPTQHKTLR